MYFISVQIHFSDHEGGSQRCDPGFCAKFVSFILPLLTNIRFKTDSQFASKNPCFLIGIRKTYLMDSSMTKTSLCFFSRPRSPHMALTSSYYNLSSFRFLHSNLTHLTLNRFTRSTAPSQTHGSPDMKNTSKKLEANLLSIYCDFRLWDCRTVALIA